MSEDPTIEAPRKLTIEEVYQALYKDYKKARYEIGCKVQDIFFDLEEFSEHDTANAAQSSAIKLMDEIASIRKRILQGGNGHE